MLRQTRERKKGSGKIIRNRGQRVSTAGQALALHMAGPGLIPTWFPVTASCNP